MEGSIWIQYWEYVNKLTFILQISLKWTLPITSPDFLEGNVGEFYTLTNAGNQKVLICQKGTESNFYLHYLATELPNAVFYPILALLTFCQWDSPHGQSGCAVIVQMFSLIPGHYPPDTRSTFLQYHSHKCLPTLRDVVCTEQILSILLAQDECFSVLKEIFTGYPMLALFPSDRSAYQPYLQEAPLLPQTTHVTMGNNYIIVSRPGMKLGNHFVPIIFTILEYCLSPIFSMLLD